MAGIHVAFQQQGVLVGFEGAKLGHVFGRLVEEHLAVVERRGHDDGRVVTLRQVVVRRIFEHVVAGRRFLRVAPFEELLHGQRQRFVEHGVDHIHERHRQVGDLAQVGTQVQRRSDQEAAGAAALDRKTIAGAVLFLHQHVGAGDEIGEGVFLVQQLAVEVPIATHVRPAANVGKGEHDAAVKQRQSGGAEVRVGAEAVGAVAVQEQRRLAILHQALLVDDRQGHLHAIRGGGFDPFADVVLGVEAAGHFGGLQELAFTGRQLVRENRGRRHQARVHEPDAVGVVLRVGAHVHVVARFREGEPGRLLPGEVVHAQLRNAGLALRDHGKVLEQADSLDEHGRLGRFEVFPVLRVSVGHARHHPLEVDGAILVGADVELPVAVVNRILDALLARREQLELSAGRRAVQEALFGRGGTGRGMQDVFLVVRAVDAKPIQFVLLLVDEPVFFLRLADDVMEQFVRSLGLVLDHVKDGLAVPGPLDAGDLHELVLKEFAGRKVLDREVILAEAGGVGEESVEVAVIAGADRLGGEEFLSLGQLVDVDQDLLGRLQRALLPAEDRVLLPLDRAGVVPVTVVPHRHAEIGLLDVRQHFLVEFLLERLEVLGDLLAVGIFGIEELNHLGVFLVLHPEVGVFDLLAMEVEAVGLGRGDRRLRPGRLGDQRQRHEEERERQHKFHSMSLRCGRRGGATDQERERW